MRRHEAIDVTRRRLQKLRRGLLIGRIVLPYSISLDLRIIAPTLTNFTSDQPTP